MACLTMHMVVFRVYSDHVSNTLKAEMIHNRDDMLNTLYMH